MLSVKMYNVNFSDKTTHYQMYWDICALNYDLSHKHITIIEMIERYVCLNK